MSLAETINAALAAYEEGDPRTALNILVSLPDPPTINLNDEGSRNLMEARLRATKAGRPIPAAALDWIALARHRLRKELGEQELGIVPVGLALRTALSCIRGQ